MLYYDLAELFEDDIKALSLAIADITKAYPSTVQNDLESLYLNKYNDAIALLYDNITIEEITEYRAKSATRADKVLRDMRKMEKTFFKDISKLKKTDLENLQADLSNISTLSVSMIRELSKITQKPIQGVLL